MLKEASFNELARDHQALLFDFVITELELAITFHRRAISSCDPGIASRNTENARRARRAARKVLEGTKLSREQRQEVDLRLDRLKELAELA